MPEQQGRGKPGRRGFLGDPRVPEPMGFLGLTHWLTLRGIGLKEFFSPLH